MCGKRYVVNKTWQGKNDILINKHVDKKCCENHSSIIIWTHELSRIALLGRRKRAK